MTDPQVSELQALLAAERKRKPRDRERERELERQIYDARLGAHIKRVVDKCPPLTAEQRARLAVLLN